MARANNFAVSGEKYCSGCNATKPIIDFGKQKSRKDGLEFRCKQCMREYSKKRYAKPESRKIVREAQAKWRKANPDADTNKHLIRKYGITLEQYNEMLEEQNGVCAICEKEEKTRRTKKSPGNERLAVDHCHETGAVRGLLCFKCNTAIGSLGDNQKMIMRVVFYLTKSLQDKDGDVFHIDSSKLN